MGFRLIVSLAVIVHLILLLSIFDVYYKSPLVHGMTPHKIEKNAPAKRIVLFVADGLRLHSFLETDQHKQYVAPSVMENVGRWGISHTRVPTESRPGHVALIAGFYEDVSAVATGWKENPVHFDSLFNQSTFTWSWGSPDILPMFAKGSSGTHVKTFMYSPEEEDFASKDASLLDIWVFDKVKQFLSDANSNSALRAQLEKPGVVLFLHLLGIDTNGHGNKPESKEYIENIGLVDRNIKDIEQIIDQFFGYDNRTAFIFTSDHGMTDWGAHGAGNDHETMTPLVVWGAGIGPPLRPARNAKVVGLDKYDLEKLPRRFDVSQADIAALMAVLIGVNFPMNSVGIVPVQYLELSDKFISEAQCTNYRQILEIFLRIREDKKKQSIFFTEYHKMTPLHFESIERELTYMRNGKLYRPASLLCRQKLDDVLQGIQYFHHYERGFLSVCIVAGFLAWILLVIAASHNPDKVSLSILTPNLIIGVLLIGIGLLLRVGITKLPLTHILYVMLPVYLGVTSLRLRFYCQRSAFCTVSMGDIGKGIVLVLGIEVLVLGFFYRWMFSGVLILLAILPYFIVNDNRKYLWTMTCIVNAIFPTLPTVQKDTFYSLVLASSILAPFLLFACSRISKFQCTMRDKCATLFVSTLIVISGCLAYNTSQRVGGKLGVPIVTQCYSWSTLAVVPLLPVFLSGNCAPEFRFIFVSACFYVYYLLVSISYEALFFIAFCALLHGWICMERLFSERSEFSEWTLARRAYFAVFFTLLSFYGTGNLASVNSFNPSAIQCFITVFKPFVMGSLLVGKVLVLFLMVACWRTMLDDDEDVDDLVKNSKFAKTRRLFLWVLILCDLMAMVKIDFFLLVK